MVIATRPHRLTSNTIDAPGPPNSVARLELDLLQIQRARLDLERLTEPPGRAAAHAVLLPDEHSQLPAEDRGVLDLEVAVLVGHREVRVIEHAHPRLHPWVDRARHLDW